MEDKRIHLIIFFLDGHRVKKQDLVSVAALQEYTNVIPVIAKRDTFTVSELKEIKKKIILEAKQFE